MSASRIDADRIQGESSTTTDTLRPHPITHVVGTTAILVVAFVLYDVLCGRELQPVGYAIMLVLWPPAMIAGRAIYIRRMNRRAQRS